jgi:hypothetical protein
MSLRFVSSLEQLHANIDAFVECLAKDPDLARELVRRGTYIAWRAGAFAAAPCKFCGYDRMTAPRYRTAGAEPGAPFNGMRARVAIESLLAMEAEPDAAVSERFVAWIEECLPGVCEGIDTGKWHFVLVPSAPPAPSAAPPEGPRLANWPSYTAAQDAYGRLWHAYNDVLYRMCAESPRHTVLADVVAKVGIIARAYATQLERHASRDGDGAIIDVATALHHVGDELDERIDALRPRAGHDEALGLDTLADLVQLHAWVGERVSSVLRGENSSPSFVSKYLHFHLPAVPIYDSRARTVVNGFYPAYGNRNKHLPRIRGADAAYHDFCNRFWSLWSEAERDGLTPSTRRLDQYLLYCHDTQAWDG